MADAIFTPAKKIEQGQASYAYRKAHAAKLDHNPDEIAIRPGFAITIGHTDKDAPAIYPAYRRAGQSFE